MTRGAALVTACLVFGACRTLPPWRAVSPDLSSSIEVAQRGRRACVTVDHRRASCFDGVSIHAITFSMSGGHSAYPVRIGTRWAMVRDGSVGRQWDGLGVPVFSSDGSTLAYPALDGAQWRLIVNEVAGEGFDAIMAGSIVIAPVAHRLAYVARRGDAVHVVVDDSLSRGWDAVARLTLTSDGRHAGYVGRTGGRMSLVVDGHVVAEHEALGEFTLREVDGSPAYAAHDSEGWGVVDGTTRFGPFAEVRALARSPASGSLFFIGRRDSMEAVFIDGAASGRRYTTVDEPVFAGSHWGYIAHDADSSDVVVDGELVAREEYARDLAIAANGERYAYVSTRGDARVIADERGRHEQDIVIDGTLQFIDGGRWVCLAGERRTRRLFVIVDGKATNQHVDWSELIRLVHTPRANDLLRAWVAAAGARAAGESGPPR